MISIEDTNLQTIKSSESSSHLVKGHLLAIFAVPDVNATVAGARDDELGVGGEGGFQGQLLGVQVTWG